MGSIRKRIEPSNAHILVLYQMLSCIWMNNVFISIPFLNLQFTQMHALLYERKERTCDYILMSMEEAKCDRFVHCGPGFLIVKFYRSRF